VTAGWRYVITRRAAQDLERLDLATRRRVFATLNRLISHPEQVDRRKLQGQDDEWRLRVGDIRRRPLLAR
jgi:mRNA-degrading endonuclease RelE of RelBE toxin-antitoxin system